MIHVIIDSWKRYHNTGYKLVFLLRQSVIFVFRLDCPRSIATSQDYHPQTWKWLHALTVCVIIMSAWFCFLLRILTGSRITRTASTGNFQTIFRSRTVFLAGSKRSRTVSRKPNMTDGLGRKRNRRACVLYLWDCFIFSGAGKFLSCPWAETAKMATAIYKRSLSAVTKNTEWRSVLPSYNVNYKNSKELIQFYSIKGKKKISHRSPMQIEKSQPSSQRKIPETR